MSDRAVVFDVGEVLISEERIWSRWADHLGIARWILFVVLGAVVQRGGHHREVFDDLLPGFDVDAAMRDDPALGSFDADDLYADARPVLEALAAEGYRLGIAGNQPESAAPVLEALDLPVAFVATSARWGVDKPDPAFFARVVDAAGLDPERIAYVGDRVDNDVLPALEAGLRAVFVRRGPWGHVQARRPDAARAHARIDSLAELPRDLESIFGR